MAELNLREADRLEITILVDNYTDILLLQGTDVVKRAAVPPPNALLAEHGLSCLLKVYADSEEQVVLFDTSISPIALLHNAETLGVDLNKIESVVLSHGHFDHFGGLIAFLNKAQKGIPLILHPDAFLPRRLNLPALGVQVDLPRLDEAALKETGVAIDKRGQASTMASDLVGVLGQVERVTEFEKGFPWAEALIDDEWVVDPFNDDQGVVIRVKGKGLVVLSGCAHAGIINTVKHARKVSGVDKVHAVLGGFHLTGPLFEPIIGPTIEETKKLRPDYIVPMHCTGWNAISQFAREMPEQFVLNSVGTTYVFE